MNRDQKSSNWKRWALRLIGLSLFVFIVMRVGKEALFSEILSTRWSFVLVAAFLCAGHFCMKAVRWHYILGKQRIFVSLPRVIVAYCTGTLIGAVTPGRIGELSKVVFVRSWQKDAANWGTAFGTIVLDRIADIVALILVSVIGTIWFLFPYYQHLLNIWVLLLAFISLILICFLIMRLWIFFKIGTKLLNLLHRKTGKNTQDFLLALKTGSGKNLFPVIFWTLAAYILFFMHFVFLCRAVGSEISFHVLIWAIALASLGAILPISISGIGVRDYILVNIFVAWDGTAVQGFTVSLIYLCVFNLVVAMIGIWPLITGDIDFKSIQKRRME